MAVNIKRDEQLFIPNEKLGNYFGWPSETFLSRAQIASGGSANVWFSTYYEFIQESRMFKNVAGQKIALFAFNRVTLEGFAGDAANILAYVAKDGGAITALGDTTATEKDATNAKGWYEFDVTQAESNANDLLFTGKSSTANISVIGFRDRTDPNRFGDLLIASDGVLDANAVKHLGTAYAAPTVAGVPEVDATHLNGVAQSLLDLKDFADDGYDPATNKVQGVVLVDTAATLTGNTPQTGDSFARIGVNGSGLTNIDLPNQTMDIIGTITTVTNLTNAPSDSSGVTTLLSRLPAGLFTGLTSFAQWLGLIAGKQVGNATARTEIRATGAGAGTYDEVTDSQEALKDDQMTSTELENSVWNANRSGHVAAGTFGEYVPSDMIKINGSGPAAVALSNGALSSMSATVDTAFFASTTTAFEILGTIANPSGLVGRVVIFYTGNDIRTAVTISAATTQGTNTRLTVAAMPAAPADGDLAVIV